MTCTCLLQSTPTRPTALPERGQARAEPVPALPFILLNSFNKTRNIVLVNTSWDIAVYFQITVKLPFSGCMILTAYGHRLQ